jgi:hypothetical protein
MFQRKRSRRHCEPWIVVMGKLREAIQVNFAMLLYGCPPAKAPSDEGSPGFA